MHLRFPRVLSGFLRGSVVKNLPANAADEGLIPGWGRSPSEGNDNPFYCSCLGNPTDRGAWRAALHGSTGVGHSLATEQQQNNLSCGLIASVSFSLNSIAWSVKTTAHLSVHLLKDILVAFGFWQLRTKNLQISMCRLLCAHKFSPPLCKYQEA